MDNQTYYLYLQWLSIALNTKSKILSMDTMIFRLRWSI